MNIQEQTEVGPLITLGTQPVEHPLIRDDEDNISVLPL